MILREVGGIARSVDGIASDVAKTVLGGQDHGSAPLAQMIGRTEDRARFAASLYVALNSVLGRLGAKSVFVSEAAAYGAFQTIDRLENDASIAGQAAFLALRLMDARVIRGTTIQQSALVSGTALEPVALFAVLLWLQSERTDEDNEAVLIAATDMAVVRAADISSAFAARDATRIAALFSKYVAHV